MNEASEPTPGARFCARVLSFCEILGIGSFICFTCRQQFEITIFITIVLGPLTLISTLASSLLCCSCIMLKLSAVNDLYYMGLID